jgi:hypothetical protein
MEDSKVPAESEPLDDLLQEIRVLLSGAQVLTAFLMTLPFSSGFGRLNSVERIVYVATFITALLSLVLFATPAAYHRLVWPVPDRRRFKRTGTQLVIAGLLPLSASLILATHLVLTEVLRNKYSTVVTVFIAGVIGVFWWVWPLSRRYFHSSRSET